MKRDEERNSYTGLLYVTEVYALQFMNTLNSVFGADRATSNKTKEKTKGGKNFQLY